MDSSAALKNENPKATASTFSKLFFAWMISLYRKGAKSGLEVSDLYKILQSDSSQELGDKLEKNWNEEIARATAKQCEPKLLRAIARTFFWNYMIYGAILFVQHVGLRSLQPVVLSYLIVLFSENEETTTAKMYISASILVTISILVIFSMHHTVYGQAGVGMRVRIAVSSLIYRKTLKLNKKSLGETAVGKVVNLLSNDVTRFDLVMLTLHYLWIMPFQAALVTYLVWQQVGISSLVGVASIALLSLPVQGYLGKLTSNLRLKVAQKTDYRVTLMGEIISGIQVIKMYAWEKPFKIVVKLARLEEVKTLTLTSYLRGMYLSFMLFVERVALFSTTTSYVLMGNVILAEKVFSMAQFFSLLQLTMAIFYPMSISYGAEALVTISRVQEFLLMKENEESGVETDFNVGVLVKNVSAAWNLDGVTLENINLRIPPGSLCVIIGPVGAGKSSFLQLLLGELPASKGNVKVEGDISYASQDSWLFASTVRNNILFGQRYDKRLYKKVVKVCALEKDFDQLPLGDKTLVGERGTALSGGQRARVNLARAIYRQADIYLLDDPLSAVDPHVGKHLFNECIVKYLKGKTRILVTHQLQHLKKADTIILITEGKIETQGTYEELRNSQLNFTQVMADEAATEKEVPQELELTFEPTAPLLLSSVRTFRNPPQLLSNSFMLESLDIRSSPIDEEGFELPGVSPLKEYIKASGSFCSISVLVILIIASQAPAASSATYRTEQESTRGTNETIEYYPFVENDAGSYTYTIEATKNVNKDRKPKLIETLTAVYIYSGLIIAAVAISLIRSCLYFKLAMNASKKLHKKMFATLLEAPMKFFNTNPSGRILNRFSRDIGTIDELLPKVLLESIQITLVLCGILTMVVISNYYMIVAVVFLGLVFMQVRSWFIKTSKNIKHLEGITKSPMFSHLNSSLNGITTIRAFGAQEMLKNEFDALQDIHTSAWSLTITCMVSFGLWLDIICVFFIGCTTFSFIILHQFGNVSGSSVGLAISQALSLTGMLQYGIRQTAEVINQLTSVERVLQYTRIEKEGPFETTYENLPQEPWPSDGLLELRNLYLQYSPGDPPVLKNLNVTIKPGQKIGIVGRTGAGKSSLISAFFRLTDFDGYLFIDGVDTKHLGLHELRKKISIIPQEPVLFSASLRYNLDPFSEFDDANLWKVLEEVELKDVVQSLDVMVAGGGNNFSVGQRQLVCLARAILRNNKVLVLDEATANIDPKTDSLIQKTIRKKFKKCTVLTVAHRLNTIIDSDRVMVMEAGEIVEFDYPYKLLQNTETLFFKMVLDTGLAMSMRLEDLALHAFVHKRS